MDKVDKEEEKDDLLTPDKRALSLGKIADQIVPPENKITVLINNSGKGIRNDVPLIEVNPEETIKQGRYYIEEVHPKFGGRIPSYLTKYLGRLYEDDEDQSVEYLLEGAFDNREVLHLIGMIQLVGGTLNAARKEGGGVRLYIVEPETYCHPKRERIIMSVLHDLIDEYGFKAEEPRPEEK